MADVHIVSAHAICGTTELAHCGWCYGAVAFLMVGLAALAGGQLESAE